MPDVYSSVVTTLVHASENSLLYDHVPGLERSIENHVLEIIQATVLQIKIWMECIPSPIPQKGIINFADFIDHPLIRKEGVSQRKENGKREAGKHFDFQPTSSLFWFPEVIVCHLLVD